MKEDRRFILILATGINNTLAVVWENSTENKKLFRTSQEAEMINVVENYRAEHKTHNLTRSTVETQAHDDFESEVQFWPSLSFEQC